ncbi:MAG: aminotransferase class V-fold PLP-dependent enzyme [Gemmatimonadota bacterium]
MTYRPGRHLLQLPGPSNVPDRILRAMHRNTIDHRGPEFQALARRVLDGMKRVFRTEGRVFIYPSSATGAWEAAMTNTLSPGDRVLFFDRGFFAEAWSRVAARLGLEVVKVPGDWRTGVSAADLRAALRADPERRIRAVMVVHNETSTGVTTELPALRAVLDELAHPALFLVDAVSSLAATEYRHDEWGVDVCISGSQKALMLPPGLAFAAVGPRALERSAQATLARSYWSWSEQIRFNDDGYFPYTPATGLLFGLDEALRMLEAEGLETVFSRHARFAAATRSAVAAWGLETYSTRPSEHSNAATTVRVPEGHSGDALRRVILERWDMSLGSGLGPLADQVFRIGHLGDFNDLMLMGTLSGVEMGLRAAGVPHRSGGAQAALEHLSA